MRGHSIETQEQRVFWEHVLGQGWEERCVAVTINIGRRMKVRVSRDDAQDIFQTGLLRLLQKLSASSSALGGLQNDPEAVRRYLHGILKNLVLERSRSHGRYTQRFVPDLPNEVPAAPWVSDPIRQRQLQRLLRSLSARQLEILELRIEGLRQKEIAERLRISEPTVSREFAAIRHQYDDLVAARENER
jgi:RNA polymerase sigma factor (sigma-70 family)